MQGSPFIRAGSVVIRSSFSICFSPFLDRRQRVFGKLSAGCAVSLRISELGVESTDFDNRGNCAAGFDPPQMNVEMCATMKTSVCYRIAMLGEQYETCCSICKFENGKKHQH